MCQHLYGPLLHPKSCVSFSAEAGREGAGGEAPANPMKPAGDEQTLWEAPD